MKENYNLDTDTPNKIEFHSIKIITLRNWQNKTKRNSLDLREGTGIPNLEKKQIVSIIDTVKSTKLLLIHLELPN